MNNFSKYLCMGALGLGLWSCAADEPVSVEIPKFTGEQALMTINLYNPEADTRADGTAGDYATGEAWENKINRIDFYFYDKAGDYVTEYKGAFTALEGKPEDYRVGLIGATKIVLNHLPGKNHPAYVVAIANAPSGFNITDKPLAEVADLQLGFSGNDVRPWGGQGTTASPYDNFIMTSATHNGNTGEFRYFATALTPENFVEMSESEGYTQDVGGDWVDKDGNKIDAEPVNIYIERLASKVDLTISPTAGSKVKYDETNKWWEVEMPERELTTGYDANGVAQTIKKTYTVRIYGCGINGTAKKMRYFKRVNNSLDPVTAFKSSDGWDFSGTNRSYWARTYGYGNNKYPASFEDAATDEKLTPPNDLEVNDPNELYNLRYISWNTVKNTGFQGANTSFYIRPHTDSGEQLNLSGNQLRHSGVTEVLLAGQLVDENGKGVDLYQLGETYYTAEGIINYVLNTAGKHLWTPVKDAEGKVTGSRTITADEVEVVYAYDGVFKFQLTGEAQVWYSDADCTEGSEWGNSTTVATNNAAVLTELNSYLPEKQTYGYKDGLMYYNIPIKHLRSYTAGQQILTGMFGVVRNHWYQVTVTDITKLGHSVYRPDEQIIPPSDDTEFMVGASVKVLNWRVVKQNAEL